MTSLTISAILYLLCTVLVLLVYVVYVNTNLSCTISLTIWTCSAVFGSFWEHHSRWIKRVISIFAYWPLSTLCLRKKCHFILVYYSRVSWSCFIIFVLLETGMNILQNSYKMFNFTLTLYYLVKLITRKNSQLLLKCVFVRSFCRKFSNVRLFLDFKENISKVFWLKIFVMLPGLVYILSSDITCLILIQFYEANYRDVWYVTAMTSSMY